MSSPVLVGPDDAESAGGAAAPLSPYHAARWARDRHVEELENKIRYLRGQATVRPWQGTLRTALVPPEDERELFVNPLGVYVTDLSWTPLTDGERVNLEDVRGALDAAADQRLREAWRGQQPAPSDSALITP